VVVSILEHLRLANTLFRGKKMSENNSKKVISWNAIPPAVNVEMIARELGWSIERYKAYQDTLRSEILTSVPDFGEKLYPEEIILRWIPWDVIGEVWYLWRIILTDKRILYKYEERKTAVFRVGWHTTEQFIANHWYANIVEVKPEWQGDLGSHIEGGGGYIGGWVWGGWGGMQGRQEPIKTVQHKIHCYVTVRERNGAWQRFPFCNIENQDGVNIAKDFISMVNKLVDLAWNKKQS
jgi:hypothetical protein